MTETTDASCQVLLERLSAYLDGDLPASECSAVARHAEGCPRCRDVIADLQRTAGLCRDASSKPIPKAVRQRAQASIRRLLDQQAPPQPSRSKR